MEIPLAAKEDMGSLFVSDEWQDGTIELSNGTVIDEYPFKYEIVKDHFELKTAKGVKILPGGWVKKFSWWEAGINKERRFVAGDSFFQNNIPFVGFFEMLYEGQAALALRFQGEEVKPNYVPQFNVGSVDKKYMKKELFYLVEDQSAFPISKKNKQNLTYFKENAPKMADYIKSNRLKFNRQDDVVRIIEYYDLLISSSN